QGEFGALCPLHGAVFGSCCDMHFSQGSRIRRNKIEEITFKNYYTAYVTVRLLRRSPGQEAAAKWWTALRDLPLMDNPHTEGGSQDYFSIHRTQVEPDHVVSVRLILRQPSSAWLTFNLEEIKIFRFMEPVSSSHSKSVMRFPVFHPVVPVHVLCWFSQGLPDPQTVSSSIQQMWALTEVMQTNQTTASIGRFDVSWTQDDRLCPQEVLHASVSRFILVVLMFSFI
uniref:Nicolin 1 n=1 Tax=Sphaeramia orbicularis TaxID=375764 RepID=A0A672ZBS1_9TELE